MANDCSVTKYVKDSTNDSLPIFGFARIKVKTNSNTNGSFTTLISGNKTMVKDAAGNVLATASADAFTYSFAANSTFIIEFGKKYIFRQLMMSGVSALSSVEVNIDDFAYSVLDTNFVNAAYFDFGITTGIEGNIASYKSLIDSGFITNISANNSKLTGSLSSLNTCTTIKVVRIQGTEVTYNLAVASNFGSKSVLEEFIAQSNPNIIGNIANCVNFPNIKFLYLNGTGCTCANGLKSFLDGIASTRTVDATLTLRLPDDWQGNDAGITKYNPVITFSGGTWSWA